MSATPSHVRREEASGSRRPLRIAMLHATLPSPARGKEGGVTYQVHDLANQLAQRGHRVTVFSLDAKPAEAQYAVQQLGPLRHFSDSRLVRYYGVPLLYRRERFAGFDVVHSHGDDFLARPHPPLLRTFHGASLQEARSSTAALRRANNSVLYCTEIVSALRASAAVSVSRDAQRWLPRIRRVIPCGVNLDVFRPGSGKSPTPTVLFVGALRGRKRGMLLVEQFAQIVRVALPAAELWLVGDEPLRAPGVRSFGKVTQRELVDLYQRAWVFCLPSSYEGFGVPYIEAMACGTAVVATPNPGAREVTHDGRYGVLEDALGLGLALVELLKNDARRDLLAHRALEAVQRFSWTSVVAAYEAEYERLRDSSRAARTRQSTSEWGRDC